MLLLFIHDLLCLDCTQEDATVESDEHEKPQKDDEITVYDTVRDEEV